MNVIEMQIPDEKHHELYRWVQWAVTTMKLTQYEPKARVHMMRDGLTALRLNPGMPVKGLVLALAEQIRADNLDRRRKATCPVRFSELAGIASTDRALAAEEMLVGEVSPTSHLAETELRVRIFADLRRVLTREQRATAATQEIRLSKQDHTVHSSADERRIAEKWGVLDQVDVLVAAATRKRSGAERAEFNRMSIAARKALGSSYGRVLVLIVATLVGVWAWTSRPVISAGYPESTRAMQPAGSTRMASKGTRDDDLSDTSASLPSICSKGTRDDDPSEGAAFCSKGTRDDDQSEMASLFQVASSKSTHVIADDRPEFSWFASKST